MFTWPAHPCKRLNDLISRLTILEPRSTSAASYNIQGLVQGKMQEACRKPIGLWQISSDPRVIDCATLREYIALQNNTLAAGIKFRRTVLGVGVLAILKALKHQPFMSTIVVQSVAQRAAHGGHGFFCRI
jgi:hypothetical protein